MTLSWSLKAILKKFALIWVIKSRIKSLASYSIPIYKLWVYIVIFSEPNQNEDEVTTFFSNPKYIDPKNSNFVNFHSYARKFHAAAYHLTLKIE
jgi:hypothetical protein